MNSNPQLFPSGKKTISSVFFSTLQRLHHLNRSRPPRIPSDAKQKGKTNSVKCLRQHLVTILQLFFGFCHPLLFTPCLTWPFLWNVILKLRSKESWKIILPALIPMEHFWAVGANCCFDCFHFQLLATLGQIKDKPAATEPGN